MNKNPGDFLASSLVLIRQAKKGDKEALNLLLKRYSPRVLQIVRARLGPGLRAKLDSQDILQEAFIRAVKGFDGYEIRGEGKFLYWLSRLVKNAICDRHDYFRADKRFSGNDLPLTVGLGSADKDPTPSQFLTFQEGFQRLLCAMDELPEESRESVVHRDMEGLSFAEIGSIMGRTEDAARMLYVRAKAKLAALMEES